MYSLHKITRIDNLSRLHTQNIDKCIDVAYNSDFKSSLRLGASIYIKGSCFLWG